jgi:phosphoserine aminotransferase
VERLENYTPPWPMPKIFRLTKGGKLIEGIFRGETINTPSMLCVEDYLFALDWAESLGGLAGLMARAQANAEAVWEFCDARDWIDNLAADSATRSVTSVCLKFTDPRIQDPAGFAKAVAKRLEAEGAALDIGAYRDAPAGLRVWCGATVETADILAMLPWLEWAYRCELDAQ